MVLLTVHIGLHNKDGGIELRAYLAYRLPGAPLGNSGLSWSDVLLGNLPNIYIYAANNPSESIIAKRRGYGTISSYNVPPYGRSGLYKQLAELKGLVVDFRESPEESGSLKELIVESLISTGAAVTITGSSSQLMTCVHHLCQVRAACSTHVVELTSSRYDYLFQMKNSSLRPYFPFSGLQDDCPFQEAKGNEPAVILTHETVGAVSTATFSDYASRLYTYLQVPNCCQSSLP